MEKRGPCHTQPATRTLNRPLWPPPREELRGPSPWTTLEPPEEEAAAEALPAPLNDNPDSDLGSDSASLTSSYRSSSPNSVPSSDGDPNNDLYEGANL